MNWCMNNKHSLVLYTNTDDDYGWLDWYRKHFNYIINATPIDDCNYLDIRPINLFKQEAHNYHIIFLATDDDPSFNNDWLKLYDLKRTVVTIDHIFNNRRPSIDKHIKIRSYQNHDTRYAYPMYPIEFNDIERYDDGIHIYIPGTSSYRIDWSILNELQKDPDVHFHIIKKNETCTEIKGFDRFLKLNNAHVHEGLDAESLLKLLYRCHYLYYCLDSSDDHVNISSSGSLSMAFNCGTSLLINDVVNQAYPFKSATMYYDYKQIYPDKRDIVRIERDTYILDLDKNIRNLFPEYYLQNNISEAIIPKIIHFMWLSENNDDVPEKYTNNIQRFRDNNKDFEIKIWTMESMKQFLKSTNTLYYDFFNDLNLIISKCDFSRMVLLYYFGGIYSDLDFYCSDSITPYLDRDIILMEELPEHEPRNRQLFNGFLGSIPEHPFIKGWIDHIITILSPIIPINAAKVFDTTGPPNFWKFYESFHNKPSLTDPCIFMPYTNKHIRSYKCNNSIAPTTYTLWTEGTNWGGNSSYIWIIIILSLAALMILGILYFINNRF